MGAPLVPADRRALEQAAGRPDAPPRFRPSSIATACSTSTSTPRAASRSRGAGPGRAGRARLADVPRQGPQRSRRDGAAARDEPATRSALSRGPRGFSMDPRPAQTITARDVADRWLDLQMFDKPPLSPTLSGLGVEYRILQLYSPRRRPARGDARVRRRAGDAGHRLPQRRAVLFTARPAVDVTLRVATNAAGRRRRPSSSATGRAASTRRRPSGSRPTSPSTRRSIAADGETVRLAAGDYTVEVTRGPEYVAERQADHASARAGDRRVHDWSAGSTCRDAAGISGDHHIHAAGCLHYETPTEGVEPRDMMRHIVGEELNVGSVLTWGPCCYYQKQFFEAETTLSTRDSLHALRRRGVGLPVEPRRPPLLLRLKEQDYPGHEVLEDWPTWTCRS